MCGACVKDDRKMIVFHFISYFCFFQYINYLMKKVGPDSHHFESVCIPYHLEQVDSLYSLSCHFISVTQMSGVKQGWRHNLYIICN